jgi:outer membrane protein OmpA-like peptidoglycan-associated protein
VKRSERVTRRCSARAAGVARVGLLICTTGAGCARPPAPATAASVASRTAPDRDGDGLPDADDVCPTEPEDWDGFEDADGCPDPDNDRDRIADNVDDCPNEAELYNGFEDEDGCPDQSHYLPPAQIRILLHVDFGPGSTALSESARRVVDLVAGALSANPQIRLVEAVGLGDPTEKLAVGLSEKRAQVVADAVIAAGIARDRIRSAGYGPYCLEPGSSGFIVRFAVVDTDTGPSDEPLGCEASRRAGLPRSLQPP